MTMQQKGGWFRGTIDTNGVHKSYTSDNDVNDVPNEKDWIQVEEHYIERLRAEEKQFIDPNAIWIGMGLAVSENIA